ncbi:MAG: hypothetical protein K0S08_994 [Gammaproteobacteria bacterium]|jgi:hypothetical protein|nr:hypothetical protein [Gammaproteobacteria bacterium]
MKKIIMLGLSAGMLLLAGCATMISGSSQQVNVQAIDADTHNQISGAKCVITDSKGVSYPVDGNPGVVTLPRVYGDITVDCHASNYWQKSVGGGESFNAWTLLDVLFWPSAIVDVSTGAAKNYPSHITVLMSSKPVAKGSNKISAH